MAAPPRFVLSLNAVPGRCPGRTASPVGLFPLGRPQGEKAPPADPGPQRGQGAGLSRAKLYAHRRLRRGLVRQAAPEAQAPKRSLEHVS